MGAFPAAALAAALLLPMMAPAGAQAPGAGIRPAPALAERNAVELKHGMTLEEVEKLLGKPSRTALKNTGSAATAASLGTLQWTYAWKPERTLHIAFAALATGQWTVTSWDWSTY